MKSMWKVSTHHAMHVVPPTNLKNPTLHVTDFWVMLAYLYY